MTTVPESDELSRVLEVVPGWDSDAGHLDVLTQGWANKNYLATIGSERYVVKLLTQALSDKALSIPRNCIIDNTIKAGQSGVGAHVLAHLYNPPALVLEFLDGPTLQPDDIGKEQNLQRIAVAISRLHRRTQQFENAVSVWSFIDAYLAILHRDTLRTPDGLFDLLPVIRRMQTVLTSTAMPQVPSQIDTYAWNLIDVGDELKIIDYDFSGMSDQCFDLGDVAMEGDLDPDQTARLTEAYFGSHSARVLARVQLFGIAAQYMWSLLFTAMDQVLPAKPSETLDYWAEAELRWRWVQQQVARISVSDLMNKAATGASV